VPQSSPARRARRNARVSGSRYSEVIGMRSVLSYEARMPRERRRAERVMDAVLQLTKVRRAGLNLQALGKKLMERKAKLAPR